MPRGVTNNVQVPYRTTNNTTMTEEQIKKKIMEIRGKYTIDNPPSVKRPPGTVSLSMMRSIEDIVNNQDETTEPKN